MSRFNRVLRPLLAVGLLLVLAACATGPRVRTDADPSANFGQYRSWDWYTPIAMEQHGYSTWISDRIKANIEREMASRGYVRATANPDLRINFQAAVEERTAVYTTPRSDYTWLWSYRARSYVAVPVWYDEARVSRYTEGTLTVDLVDARTNRLAWTGDAIGRVTAREPQQRALQIDESVGAIFARFPYQAGNAQPIPLPR